MHMDIILCEHMNADEPIYITNSMHYLIQTSGSLFHNRSNMTQIPLPTKNRLGVGIIYEA